MGSSAPSVYDKDSLIRVFTKGGLVHPADLMTILDASAMLGNDFVLFGSREDILFPVASTKLEEVTRLLSSRHIDFEQGKRDLFQNIVSSAIALGITNSTTWLDLNHYCYVLGQFNYRPRLKINITDPRQAMVPLFTGHLNFIASNQRQYWHLYIRNNQASDGMEKWPTLIHSADIAKLASFLEARLHKEPLARVSDLIVGLAEHIKLNTKVSREPLMLPPTLFPYYEGMNTLIEDTLWLGLYWRNNRFDIGFLQKACELCLSAHIPHIYISPWKSFVIKDIRQREQLEWERVMGQMGVNMRHSSLELNWHIPVLDEEALALKRYLVQELDQQDICTSGLTFTVVTNDEKLWFTSIVIQKNQQQHSNQQSLFNLYYAKDFNPNTTVFYPYTKGVTKDIIPALLIELSKLYYQLFDDLMKS